jgi:hypothetical protein
MAKNEASEVRKQHIVSLLEQRLGPVCTNHPRRPDWYSSKDGLVDVFITDSKAHYGQRPWFDMKEKDIKQLASSPAGFIIFILGDEDSYLVVPATDLLAQLPHHREGRLNTGFFHFNIVLGGRAFEQLPDWGLRQYLRKIELIPQKR